MTDLEARVQAWVQARKAERDAAARIPFCSFDVEPELRAGRYAAKIQGNRLTITRWRVRPQ